MGTGLCLVDPALAASGAGPLSATRGGCLLMHVCPSFLLGSRNGQLPWKPPWPLLALLLILLPAAPGNLLGSLHWPSSGSVHSVPSPADPPACCSREGAPQPAPGRCLLFQGLGDTLLLPGSRSQPRESGIRDSLLCFLGPSTSPFRTRSMLGCLPPSRVEVPGGQGPCQSYSRPQH